jgi:hypothetical protein
VPLPPPAAAVQAQLGSPSLPHLDPPSHLSILFPLPNPLLQQPLSPSGSVELVDWGIDDDDDKFVLDSQPGSPPE